MVEKITVGELALCVVAMAPDLLGREQAFEIFDDLGWSEIFFSLVAVGEHFSLLIDDDQARNAAAGILFEG